MKTQIEYVIKSARIAKARLGKSLHPPEFQKQTLNKKNANPQPSDFPPFPDATDSKKELSHSTKCSLSPRASNQLRENPLTFKLDKSESENVSPSSPKTGGTIAGGSNLPTTIVCKRIKTSRANDFQEDNLPWTEEELQRFEILYGEIVFDNTIDLDSSRQADLNLLGQRKFRNYWKGDPKESNRWGVGEYRSDIPLARKMIGRVGSLTVSDSQLVQLMSLCQTEKVFFDLLDKRRDIVVNFFEKTKLNPRRKQLK